MINGKHVLYFRLDSTSDNTSVVRKMLRKCNQLILNEAEHWAVTVCHGGKGLLRLHFSDYCKSALRNANTGLKHNYSLYSPIKH